MLGAILLVLLASGCSSTPDAINPVEWYKGARDWVSGEDQVEATKRAKAKEAEAKAVPGADKPFPKLDSVPDRPARTPAEERKSMANSLIADRDRARYTDEQIRRQDNSVVTSESLPQAASAQPPLASQMAAPRSPAPQPPQPRVPELQASVPQAPRANIPSAPRQAVTQQVIPTPPAASGGGAASTMPPVPYQPIPPVPSQPVPVAPAPATPSTAMSGSSRPYELPSVPSTVPPPPPVIAGNDVPPDVGYADGTTETVQIPPDVNPSGGGLEFNPPPVSIQQAENAYDRGGAAPASPNSATAPQLPAYDSQAFETAQVFRPTTAPVATILFADGSSRVGTGDRQVIRQVSDEYRRRGGHVHVIGHASSRTRNLDQASHQLANFTISYERARAVAAILQRYGVPPQAIVVTAMSDQEPAYFEVMPAGEAGNRRVEIFFEN